MKQCKFTSKLAEIRENLSESGKDWVVKKLPKANLYFPNYAGVEKESGVTKLILREYEIARLRVINGLFRIEKTALEIILRRRILSMGFAFQISSIKNDILDLLARNTYEQQIHRLRQL